MARRDSTAKMFEDRLESAKKNAVLIPEIKNWCTHIVLKDVSAGMIAEMSGLPVTVQVSCPHASCGSSGMMLDWIAGDFIIENCLACSFHQPVTEVNFGTKLLAEKKKRENEEALKKDADAEMYRQLSESIGELVRIEKDKAQITELSILQLLESLKDAAGREVNAELIFQASKISPGFFPLLSLDILSLYFEDELIGGTCMQTVNEVLNAKTRLPERVFQQALKALQEGKYFNDAALLFPHYINTGNILSYEETILFLINSLWYKRSIGESYDLVHNYDNSIAALRYLIGLDRTFMTSLFKKQLQVNDKITRININYTLQEIMVADTPFVLDFLDELILSFELTDDQYEDSADHATCVTIAKLIKTSSKDVYDHVREKVKRLSVPARISSIKLFRYLLKDTDIAVSHPDIGGRLISELIQLAMSKDEAPELHGHYVDELFYMRDDQANLFEPNFDALLGFLSQLLEDQKTFLWWKEEITTKKPEEVTTYNPLLGLTWWDIDHLRMNLSKDIRHVKDILGEILEIDTGTHFFTVQQMIKGLDSKTRASLKSELISLTATSMKDPLLIAGQIPDLYNWVLDVDAIEVRTEGMKFLDRIIEKFPQLVTQTLFDLADVFLKDTSVAVKGLSLQIQASIANHIPDTFNIANIDLIIRAMMNPYVYVHKTAARKCESFIPFMDKKQHLLSTLNLISLAKHYQSDDKEFSTSIVKKLLRITRKQVNFFQHVTREFVLKNCKSTEYYTAKEYIDLLTDIKNEYPEFEDDWLKIVIDVFKKIPPTWQSDMDWRSELFSEMFTLSYGCIQRNLELILEFLNSRTETDGFDIINFLYVLAYFEFHESVVTFVTVMRNRLSRVRSTEGLFRNVEIQMNFSGFEADVKNEIFQEEYLKQITDALQKTRP